MPTATTVSTRQVIAQPRFFLLWLGVLASSLGEWLAIMAMFSIVTFRLHGTPTQVSLIMISYILPVAALGPIAGAFVDRWNVKPTLIACNLARGALVGTLAFTTQLHSFYALILLSSAVATFLNPAQSVAIPLLVRQEELLVANAIATQTLQLNKIIGPGVAGLIVAAAGERGCFLIGAGTFLAAAALLVSLAMPQRRASAAHGAGPLADQIKEGLRFLVHHRAISFVAFSMVAAMFAIGIFDSLIPVYVRDVLDERSQIFGAVLSVVGVGTIIGAQLLSRFAQRVSRVLLVVCGILGIGVSILAIAVLGHVATTLVCALALGMSVGAVMVSAQTLLQEQVPSELLGRVTSTGLSLVTISQLAAFGVAGAVAGWIGIRNLFFVAAVILLLTALYGFIRIKVRRTYETA